MKRKTLIISCVIAVCLLAVGIGGVFAAADNAPLTYTYSVTVNPQVAAYSNKTQIVIMGSGYQPKQEVRLVVKTVDGVYSELSDYLKPKPIADANGSWVTAWDLKDYVGKKLVAPGVNAIMVTDTNYNTLATTAFALVDTTKPKEEWPSWAQVVLK